MTASLLSAASTILNIPLPVTSEVTLYSTQVFILILPLLSSALVMREGRLFQVMPVSVHEVPVPYTAGPLTEPFVVS